MTWTLADFSTDTKTPQLGARVMIWCGVGSPKVLGRIVKKDSTSWGQDSWIALMDDGHTLEGFTQVVGSAIARPFTGQGDSDEPVISPEKKGIGTYLVRVE